MLHPLKNIVPALLLLAACASEKPAATAGKEPEASANTQSQVAQKPEAPSAAAALTRVDSSLVCMVNNHYMGSAQIPVAVEGKTYYGCCKMCESRLNDDPSSRMSVDPFSKQAVDKALAVVAKDDQGKVLYFENETTFQGYLASL